MAGKIRADIIERVKEETDIVALVGGYVSLKKAGSGFKGLCPFHGEKSPSFHVSPDRRMFKCFGCGKAGGVLDFVILMDKVTFPEAIEILAERAGIRVEREATGDERDSGPKVDVFRVNRWAAEFFRRNLGTTQGAGCRDYLERRGLAEEMWKRFGLGFAPDSWDALVTMARKSGVPDQSLLAAGLAKEREQGEGIYDRFRNRLVFPIRDAMDRVIAFGARSLDGSEPKYLNSPETAVFSKGRSLYAIETLRHLKADQPVLVMEGYTDVIMAHQYGSTGAVATLGTALTESHAHLLARYTQNVILVYDGDAAGRKAAERGVGLFLAVDFDLKVARLDGGEDPCDFFKRRGGDGTEELLAKAGDFLEFMLGEVAARHELTSMTGKVKAADELLQTVRGVANPVKRRLVLDRIAERLALPRADLEERLGGVRSTPLRRKEPEPAAQARPAPILARARVEAERELIAALLGTGGPWPWVVRLGPDDFLVPEYALFFGLVRGAAAAGKVEPERLMNEIQDAGARAVIFGALRNAEDDTLPEERIRGSVEYLEKARAKMQIENLRSQTVGDDERLRKLTTLKQGANFKKDAKAPSPGAGTRPAARPTPEAPLRPTVEPPPRSRHEDDDVF